MRPKHRFEIGDFWVVRLEEALPAKVIAWVYADFIMQRHPIPPAWSEAQKAGAEVGCSLRNLKMDRLTKMEKRSLKVPTLALHARTFVNSFFKFIVPGVDLQSFMKPAP